MISKNKTFAGIKDVTVIELGFGDIMISPIVHVGDKYTGVSFVNHSLVEIGSYLEDKGEKLKESDVVIVFNKLESLLVLEDAIKKAKEDFINNFQVNE